MAIFKNLLAPHIRYGQNLPALAGGFLPAYILAFLVGVLIYFKLPFEPSLGHTAVLSMLFAVMGAILLYKWAKGGWYAFLLCGWLAVTLLGLSYATWHTHALKTPTWPAEQTHTVWLTGTVEKLNAKASGFTTATLRNIETINNGNVQHWPGMIISAHTSRFDDATTGTIITVQVRLSPPSTPLHPSMYDWQMRSYFEGISATGLVMGDLYVTEPTEAPWRGKLNAFRHKVFNSITATEHVGAGVGAALLTGLRGEIAPHTADDYRRSGLAHLMAISGMHLGMLSGALYFVLLAVFVRCGKLPYKVDVRMLAAFGALIAAAGYTLMAGATVPTLRAFCLIAAAFFALLTGRIHLGVRVLALVALALVLFQPYLLLTASFQLSFVAALALVVWAYVRQVQRIDLGALTPRPNRLMQSIQVSIVATLATLPFIALHFKQVAVVGVLANVLAIPLMAFAVLPLGFLYLVSGGLLGGWLLTSYLYAAEALNQVAHFMAELPMAAFTINPVAVPYLWVVAVTLLLAFLFKRWALVLITLIAMVPLAAAQRLEGPAVIVLEGGDDILVSNRLEYVPLQQSDDLSDKAVDALTRVLPRPNATRPTCQLHACRIGNLLVASAEAELHQEDCLLNDWIVVPQQAYFSCTQGAKVYSPQVATSFALSGDGLHITEHPPLYPQRFWVMTQ